MAYISSSEDEDFFDAEDEYSIIEEGDIETESLEDQRLSTSPTLGLESVLKTDPIFKDDSDNLSEGKVLFIISRITKLYQIKVTRFLII